MTVNFVDLMIIDPDTSAFLFTIMPRLRWPILCGVVAAVPILALLWRVDPFRVRLRTAVVGSALCLAGLVPLSIAYPADFYGEFFDRDYVSKFARIGGRGDLRICNARIVGIGRDVTDRLKAPPRPVVQAENFHT